jgi:O-antigen ligase
MRIGPVKINSFSFSNSVYFLSAILLAYTLKVNVWVLEAADFAMLAILITWFIRRRSINIEKRAWKQFKSIPIAFFVFIAWSIVTILLAYNEVDQISWMNMLLRVVKQIVYSTLFWVMITEGLNGKTGYKYIFYGYIFGLFMNSVLILSGIEARTVCQETHVTVGMPVTEKYAEGLLKRRGGLTLENGAGSVAACLLILLIPLYLKKRSKIIGVAFISLMINLILGQSRGAWVTFIFGLVLLFGGSRRRTGILLVIFFVAIGAYNSPIIMDRILTPQTVYNQDFYDGARIETFAFFLKKVPEKPFAGKGYFGRFYRQDMNPSGAHNQYLQVLLETGAIGLVLYVFIFYQVYRFLKTVTGKEPRRLLMILLFTQLFSALSESFWYAGNIWGAQIMIFVYAMFYYDRERIIGMVKAGTNKMEVARSLDGLKC